MNTYEQIEQHGKENDECMATVCRLIRSENITWHDRSIVRSKGTRVSFYWTRAVGYEKHSPHLCWAPTVLYMVH